MADERCQHNIGTDGHYVLCSHGAKKDGLCHLHQPGAIARRSAKSLETRARKDSGQWVSKDNRAARDRERLALYPKLVEAALGILQRLPHDDTRRYGKIAEVTAAMDFRALLTEAAETIEKRKGENK